MKSARRHCSVDRCVLAESSDYALDGPANAGRRLPLMSAVESTPREQREGSASECTKGRSARHGYELHCIVFHRSRPPFQLVSDAGHWAFDSCDSRSKPERFILRAPKIGARERNHIYSNTNISITTRVLHKNSRILQDSTAGAARVRLYCSHQQCRRVSPAGPFIPADSASPDRDPADTRGDDRSHRVLQCRHHQHRRRAAVEHGLADRAHEQTGEPAMSAGAEHDHRCRPRRLR